MLVPNAFTKTKLKVKYNWNGLNLGKIKDEPVFPNIGIGSQIVSIKATTFYEVQFVMFKSKYV